MRRFDPPKIDVALVDRRVAAAPHMLRAWTLLGAQYDDAVRELERFARNATSLRGGKVHTGGEKKNPPEDIQIQRSALATVTTLYLPGAAVAHVAYPNPIAVHRPIVRPRVAAAEEQVSVVAAAAYELVWIFGSDVDSRLSSAEVLGRLTPEDRKLADETLKDVAIAFATPSFTLERAFESGRPVRHGPADDSGHEQGAVAAAKLAVATVAGIAPATVLKYCRASGIDLRNHGSMPEVASRETPRPIRALDLAPRVTTRILPVQPIKTLRDRVVKCVVDDCPGLSACHVHVVQFDGGDDAPPVADESRVE